MDRSHSTLSNIIDAHVKFYTSLVLIWKMQIWTCTGCVEFQYQFQALFILPYHSYSVHVHMGHANLPFPAPLLLSLHAHVTASILNTLSARKHPSLSRYHNDSTAKGHFINGLSW